MSARCYVIDVDGEPVTARWSTEPTDEDIAAFRELIRAVRSQVLAAPELTADQVAARGRIRDRVRGDLP